MDKKTIVSVKEAYDDELLKCKGVVCTDIQPKLVNEVSSSSLGITVYVKKKVPRKELCDEDVVPPEVGGVCTDVFECSHYWPSKDLAISLKAKDSAEPTLQGGECIGCDGTLVGYGTLGIAAVFNGVPTVATCAHIISSWSEAPLGENMLTCYSQKPFGKSYRRYRGQSHNVDLGLANINVQEWTYLQEEIQDIGRITGYASPRLGDLVTKYGATTKKTSGVISSVDVTFVEGDPIYGWPDVTLHHQFRIEGAWALPGDSGSVVVNQERRVVGMVVGGNAGQFTICNRAEDLMKLFNPW